MQAEELDFVPVGKMGASGLVPLTNKHGTDIEQSTELTLNIDLGQMGVRHIPACSGTEAYWPILDNQSETMMFR